MVVEYSLISIGVVPPAAPPALLSDPSVSTITQTWSELSPPNSQPLKFAEFVICVAVSPPTPLSFVILPAPCAALLMPLVVVSQ